MARRKRRRTGRRTARPNQIHPDAAGVDIGAEAVFAAVREDRASPAIRKYPTFTSDLHALADWLKECQVTTVAMESTGVYWIPIFQILEARGFEVVLVNARHVRSAPGRKSDVADSYDQMNVHLHHAISDLTGVSGLAITDAILDGARDAARLAALADRRIKASRATLTKALEGDWRPEHLFTLRQARRTYSHYQELISECDQGTEGCIRSLQASQEAAPDSSASEPPAGVSEPPEGASAPSSDPEPFNLRAYLSRLLGTDLTLIPGIGESTRHEIRPPVRSWVCQHEMR